VGWGTSTKNRSEWGASKEGARGQRTNLGEVKEKKKKARRKSMLSRRRRHRNARRVPTPVSCGLAFCCDRRRRSGFGGTGLDFVGAGEEAYCQHGSLRLRKGNCFLLGGRRINLEVLLLRPGFRKLGGWARVKWGGFALGGVFGGAWWRKSCCRVGVKNTNQKPANRSGS